VKKLIQTPGDCLLTVKGFTSKDEIDHFIVWLSDHLELYHKDWSEGDSVINPKIRETLYVSKAPVQCTNNLVTISLVSDLD